MVSIKIAGLKAGAHEFMLEPSASDLELDPDVFREIQVAVHLDRRADKAYVVFDAEAVAFLRCDRTLVDFDQPISGHHELLFAPPEMVEARDDDHLRPLRPDDEEIDLTDVVRDTLVLAVPQRKVAPGAEDVEIPTRFGDVEDDADRIDPRWAALRALRDRINDQ